MKKRVLVVVPNDFRVPPRERFRVAQWSDAHEYCAVIESLGCETHLIEEDLIEPHETYTKVAYAIKSLEPSCVIMRCYLWADPPNGIAVFNAAGQEDIPVAASAYSAPLGAPLGEAPGEVFMLHTTANARHFGLYPTRLYGPLKEDGSEKTIEQLRSFINGSHIGSARYPIPCDRGHRDDARKILNMFRGRIIAMTGGNSMGMLTCGINTQYHCGPRGWGFNIPIIPPDLYEWDKRVNDNRARFIRNGSDYYDWLVAKGVRFLHATDWDGSPLEADERDYNKIAAVEQLAYYSALTEICDERKIYILGIPAQLQMTNNLFCGDLIKGVAMSSEGPEGRHVPLHWMTEGDMDQGISNAILYEITGNPAVFCDVRCRIPDLGPGAFMMCNSGAACADAAEKSWESIISVRQYKGYFEAGGGTFAFRNPSCHPVIGLRTAVDHEGIYACVAIGETIRSDDPRHVVDGRWPQYKVDVYADEDQCYEYFPTNHFGWAKSDDPIHDARVAIDVIGSVGGRCYTLYDGRLGKL